MANSRHPCQQLETLAAKPVAELYSPFTIARRQANLTVWANVNSAHATLAPTTRPDEVQGAAWAASRETPVVNCLTACSPESTSHRVWPSLHLTDNAVAVHQILGDQGDDPAEDRAS